MTRRPASDAVRLEAVMERHERAFGVGPQAVAFAPGRVNLMGDHTDYNGGLSLPIAIDRGTACSVSRREDGVVAMLSAQVPDEIVMVDLETVAPSSTRGWSAYVAGSVEMARRAGWHHGGVSICVDGDVPRGAGLSSSAALECAVVLALVELGGRSAEPMEIALAAQAAEHEFAGMPCGILDQATSMLAREGQALLLDSGSLSAVAAPLGLEALGADGGVCLLVIDTRAHHELTDGGYADRRAACERAASMLGVRFLAELGRDDLPRVDALAVPLGRRARHVVTENARVAETVDAFAAHDRIRLGHLFAASHCSLAEDFEVSCPELDVAVAAAVGAGAVGARMTGGGFGGSAVALVDQHRVVAVTEAVTSAFRDAHFDDPGFLTVAPAPGARILLDMNEAT